jgi:hypothetical protein
MSTQKLERIGASVRELIGHVNDMERTEQMIPFRGQSGSTLPKCLLHMQR